MKTLFLVYENKDKCAYTVYDFDTKQFYTINPGPNNITKRINESEADQIMHNKYQYYRGRFCKDLNPMFVYAMPVKEGIEVEWMMDPRERMKSYMFKINYRDTVYAARNGVVCNSDFNYGILMHHADNTFGGYLNLCELFVYPGSYVGVGDPIGLANLGGVSFSVFFLDKNMFDGEKPSGYPYSQLSPYFRTSEGDVKLEKGKKYTAVKDDALIMQEMSKAEQKRHLKKKKK